MFFRINVFDFNLKYVNALLAPLKNNILMDIVFQKQFNLQLGQNNIYQVAESIEEDELGAVFFKYPVQERFEYSSSLNKIKSNEYLDYRAFIAVGNSGMILLLNKEATTVEDDNEENKTQTNLNIFPNPISNNTTLNISSDKLLEDIVIYNLVGKTVFETNNVNSTTYSKKVNTFPKGIYFIKSGSDVVKFVVSE